MPRTTNAAMVAALLVILPVPLPAAEILKPQISEPLQDAAVTRAPDGTYYLTGTRAMAREWDTKPGATRDPYFLTESKEMRKPDGSLDFMCNDGVKVWSSTDLSHWKDEGLVWDLLTQQPAGYYDWRARVFAHPDRAVGDRRVRGVTSPRLQFFDGKCLLVHSLAGHDVGIMLSKSGKVSGPYDPHYKQGKSRPSEAKFEQTSHGPGHGSLFSDRDGQTYLVRGPGFLWKLTPDLAADDGEETPRNGKPLPPGKAQRAEMAGRPGQPVDLLAQVAGFPNAEWCAQQFAPRAGSVFLHKGKYCFTWSAMTDKDGVKREDSFIAVAARLEGPYSAPQPLVPGSGPVWPFETDKGAMLSCSIGDAPVLISLEEKDGALATVGVETPKPIPTKHPGKPVMFDYANSRPSGKWHEPHPTTGRSRLMPVFDLPLTDTSIAKGGDGAWYMTGTVASIANPSLTTNPAKGTDYDYDFENNDGIYLWRSEDLATWLPLGKVWDIEKDGVTWQKHYRVPANNPTHTQFARGVTAPEMHFARGTYWIAYSMNGRGTGLLKSTSGKAEGPYEDLGRFTGMGGSPSLFAEEEGQAYWLWGDLRAAQLGPDWKALEGPAPSLYLQLAKSNLGQFHDPTDLWEHKAPHLFTAVEPKSKQKKYYLTCAAITQRNGRANRETFVAEAAHPLGPYTEPFLMIPHGGQTSVFKGPGDKLYASFFGADPTAAFRDRPGIVPVEFGVRDLPRKANYNYYTQRGPWDSVETPLPNGIADYRLTYLPDGNFYLGSSLHVTGLAGYHGTVPIWQSPDLKNWKVLERLYTHEQAEREPGLPSTDKKAEDWQAKPISWATGLYYIKGKYMLRSILTGVRGKPTCSVTLVSESGKPEGPYRFHASLRAESLFEDDDGSVYGALGASSGSLLKLTPDVKAVDETWASPLGGEKQFAPKTLDNTQMANDCGSAIWKVDGKYVVFTLDGWGSYPTRYFWADRIVGPWRELGHIAYAGHGQIARGPDGTWWTGHQFLHEHYNYCAPTEGGHTVFLPVVIDMRSSPPRIEYQFDYEAGVRQMSVY